MQLMPPKAVRLGVWNRFNAEENIRAGTAWLGAASIAISPECPRIFCRMAVLVSARPSAADPDSPEALESVNQGLAGTSAWVKLKIQSWACSSDG